MKSYGQQRSTDQFCPGDNASLLLMDEPTNGLDIVSKSQFRKGDRGIAGLYQCIVISTHQVKDLENLMTG